jgi:hypothetical protein
VIWCTWTSRRSARSRLAHAEILADERGTACAGFLLRAAAWFAGQGVRRVRRVLTDNSRNYLISRDFTAAVTAIGARVVCGARP